MPWPIAAALAGFRWRSLLNGAWTRLVALFKWALRNWKLVMIGVLAFVVWRQHNAIFLLNDTIRTQNDAIAEYAAANDANQRTIDELTAANADWAAYYEEVNGRHSNVVAELQQELDEEREARHRDRQAALAERRRLMEHDEESAEWGVAAVPVPVGEWVCRQFPASCGGPN